eukprot:ANDGO_07069.mRNA.1 putative histidine ammonia-lyase
MNDPRPVIELNGRSLSVCALMSIADGTSQVSLCPAAMSKVSAARKVVDSIIASGRIKYGINTGFGKFATVSIDNEKLTELQHNLVRSHSSGVGEPLPPSQTRALLALRINALLKGHSGIVPASLHTLCAMLNKGLVAKVPCQGTVGASGDLAPLAHLALAATGEGWILDSYRAGQKEFEAAEVVMARHGLVPLKLAAKEGLALINGTQFISSFACEALFRAKRVLDTAIVAASLSLEGLRGTPASTDPRGHWARPHPGQMQAARLMRHLLLAGNEKSPLGAAVPHDHDSVAHEHRHHSHSHDHDGHGQYAESVSLVPSEICNSHAGCGKVQDGYSLRCVPQVHGIAADTIAFVERILEIEINSATDNPMVFDETHWDSLSKEQQEELSKFYAADERVISQGNFHGEYPAKAADYLAIGVAELASISERRIERLMNSEMSGLPAFLVPSGGLHSGFMIAHCAAASLVSENKALCHPASVDSISTSAGQEDHVSMGGWAARKAVLVVQNVERVLAIEIMCACQAIDFLRPLKTSPSLEAVWNFVRRDLNIPFLAKDRVLSDDIEKIACAVRAGAIAKVAFDKLREIEGDALFQ